MTRPTKIHIDEYDPRPADTLGFSADWREAEGWLIKLATRSRFSHIAGIGQVDDYHLHRELQRRREELGGCSNEPGCRWAKAILRRGEPRQTRQPRNELLEIEKRLELLHRNGWQSRRLLFESTTLNDRACILQGKKVCGVQAHDPRKRILAYRGRVWLFRPAVDYRVDYQKSEKLTAFLLRHLGDRYDYRQAGLSASFLVRRAWWASQADLHSLFCSEYWAAALEQIDMLQLQNPSKFSPARLIHSVLELGSMQLVGEIVR